MRFLLPLLLAVVHASATTLYYQDWEAHNWAVSVGPSGNTYIAATRFMLQTRAAGLRRGIVRANLMAGPSATTARTPIILDLGTATDSNTGSAPTYSETNGVTFTTGGTEMFTTGVNPTNFALNSAHMAIYLGIATLDANVVMGAQTFGNKKFFSMATSSPGEGLNIWTNAGFAGASNTNGSGYFMGSRTSGAATGVSMYRFGIVDATSTAVGSDPPDLSGSAGVFVMGLNNSGSPILATAHAGRGYQLGNGFNAVQAASSFAIWQRFESTLNRAVVPY